MLIRLSPIAAALAFSFLSCTAFATDLAPQLLKKAEAEQKSYLATVKELVDIDTGTGQALGLKTVSAMLVERLKGLGAEVTTTPATPSAGDNIVGTLKGTGSKNFLLMVHYDTVFGPGTAAKRPFKLDGERAYGPGVADAKGGVAMILHSLQLLQDQKFNDFGTLTVLFNPDEETGSAGSKKNHRRARSSAGLRVLVRATGQRRGNRRYQRHQRRVSRREGQVFACRFCT